MSAQLYEKLGRKQELIEAQDLEYQRLFNLLAGVVGGDVDPSRVLVNMTDRTWTMVEPGQVPPMPATINGRPVCITAPPKPAPTTLDATGIEGILAKRNGHLPEVTATTDPEATA